MRIKLLPSSFAAGSDVDPGQYLTSFLVNDTLAIDAGSLGFYGTPREQARIKHVVITHSHSDHVASLPVFVENAFEARPECVTIYGSEAVLDGLQFDIFNDRVWPDFIRLSRGSAAPFLRLEVLEPGRPLELDGLRLTPVAVDHNVPTLGLVLEEPGAAVVLPSDTGPTEEIWRRGNAATDLKGVFLEVAFPDAMARLAADAKHLTPTSFAGEVHKLRPGVRVFAVHIKPRFFGETSTELLALGLPDLEICRPGRVYQF